LPLSVASLQIAKGGFRQSLQYSLKLFSLGGEVALTGFLLTDSLLTVP
jgi:hypothetical protein